ncbi:MAG: hypothetical protein JO247_23925, partial [Chloroflexi bacterium]|nr:hypothetical protein [Chloroflexota bacterium]
ANGNVDLLTAGYVIDAESPDLENPLHFPINTLVIFPPEVVKLDPINGTITANTQAIGSTLSVITNPVGYVQTTSDAPELSSFADNAQTFTSKAPNTYLQVVEPQIGNRLLVLDPDTGNYAYVNASDVGPSGPPPGKTAAAVVRGLLSDLQSPPAPAPQAPSGSSAVVRGLLDLDVPPSAVVRLLGQPAS